MVQVNSNTPKLFEGQYHVALPGKDRKRQPADYEYRLTYRSPDPEVVGCVATWEVMGGREPYQIALERLAGGWRRWHCTCPDAVYRSEATGRVCKHILGLCAFGPVADPALTYR